MANRVRGWPPAGRPSSRSRSTPRCRSSTVMELAEPSMPCSRRRACGCARRRWRARWRRYSRPGRPRPGRGGRAGPTAGIKSHELGDLLFVYAVAPHHPLASGDEPIPTMLIRHRAVAVADSAAAQLALTVGLLAGQDVLTVPTMRAKLDAQLRWIGCGFLPEPLARPHVRKRALVVSARCSGRRDASHELRLAQHRHAGKAPPRAAVVAQAAGQPHHAQGAARAAPPARMSQLPRPLRALAHRAAARRLAGGRAGQLARCPRARRPWLVRIEDVDRHAASRAPTTRSCASCALRPASPTSRRSGSPAANAVPGSAGAARAAAPGLPLRLLAQGHRSGVARPGPERERHGELVYPGTCRSGLRGKAAAPGAFRVPEGTIAWTDRRSACTCRTSRRGRRLRAQARRRPVRLPAGRGGRRRRPGHHACRARRRPGGQHAAPAAAAAGAGLPATLLPARAAGAGPQRREAVQAERRRAAGPGGSARRGAAAAAVLGIALPPAPLADTLAQAVAPGGARWP